MNRDHVEVVGTLQEGVFQQVVQNDVLIGIFFRIDHNPQAFTVAFVTNFRDARNLRGRTYFVNFTNENRLVHVIRQLRNDQLRRCDLNRSTDDDAAFAGFIGFFDAINALNRATSGKVWSRHDCKQRIQITQWFVDAVHDGSQHFGDVVRRNVRRIPTTDSGASVDKQVWKASGQDDGFVFFVVKVGDEIHGVLVDVLQQHFGDARQTGFGITHRGRGIAIDRSVVSVHVDQGHVRFEVLGQANHRFINARVAVGVIFPHDFPDDAGGFLVRFVAHHAHFVHSIQNASLNGFQSVFDVGQGAFLNDVLGVGRKAITEHIFQSRFDDLLGVFEQRIDDFLFTHAVHQLGNHLLRQRRCWLRSIHDVVRRCRPSTRECGLRHRKSLRFEV